MIKFYRKIFSQGLLINTKVDNKHYGIDAAFGILSNSNRTLYTEFAVTSADYFEEPELSYATCLRGSYTQSGVKIFKR